MNLKKKLLKDAVCTIKNIIGKNEKTWEAFKIGKVRRPNSLIGWIDR